MKTPESESPAQEAPTAEVKLTRAQQKAREQAKRTARARQKLLLSLIGVALVLNGLLAYVLHGNMVTRISEQRLAHDTREEAQIRVLPVQRYLVELNQAISEVAGGELMTTLAAAGPEQRADAETIIAGYFPGALAVRLIPQGTAAMDRDHAVPIRFAELDLIRRAERREAAPPEMMRIDDVWHLHLATTLPLDTEQPVWGVLLITLDNQALSQRFRSADAALGQTELIQRISGSQPVLLMQSGSGSQAPTVELPVRNSHWHLRFTPSPSLIARAEEQPTLWLLVVCASTAASIILVWLLSWIVTRRKYRPTFTPTADTASVASGTAQDSDGVVEALANPLYHTEDVLDIAVIDEDEDILGLSRAPDKKTGSKADANSTAVKQRDDTRLPQEIFRAYDIRGIAGKQLTPELAEYIGQAVGSEALDQGENTLAVARDGRTHSPVLCEHLIKGIRRSGCHVLDLGVVPTPVLYFATHHLEETSSGVMVTASHNPAEYNGFKIVINGNTLADEAVQDIRLRIQKQDFHRGMGELKTHEIIPAYIERIFTDVALAGHISLVIDAGNAVTGVVAPRLFEELGCDVIPLYCDLDGHFPNHDPDPTQEKNLQDLLAKVQESGADLGVAFDGDGDRLVVVTPTGRIIWPDQLLMLFARDILARNPGADVLFDVKCSRQLNQLITSYGGRPIMWKTGHSPMKSKMIETGALLGGEYSGHIFIKDRWYGFDDGMYAMARLLEIITLRDQKIDQVFDSFPVLPATPELRIDVPEDRKFALVEQLIAEGDFANGKLTTIDGLRVDFAKGWGLVRASNTSPALTLRFEAETPDALKKIQQLFKRELLKVDSRLSFTV